MKISQTGINLIKSFEGLRLSAYKAVPSEKYYTIGYGHYGPDVAANAKITEAQAEKYLFKDVSACESVINSSDWNVLLTQNKFDALTSFCYNLGTGTVKKLAKEKDDKAIVTTMKKYVNAGGKKLPGLVRRREEEAKLYSSSNQASIFKCPQNLHLKSVYELAQDVLNGELGNGDQRKLCLGNKYNEVQNEVNRIIKEGSTNNSRKNINIDELARDTINGKYGAGEERKRLLGANYAAVQKRVNEMMKK